MRTHSPYHAAAALALLLVWGWIGTATTNGQTRSNFGSLNRTDGLSSDVVLSMSQDTLGFLWIGTTNGLNRFDGVRVRTFDADPDNPYALPHRRVNTVFTSRDGDLWFGTHNGLARYDPDTDGIEKISFPGIDIPLVVHGIAQDSTGLLWLSTWQTGLFTWDPRTDSHEWVIGAPEEDDPQTGPRSFNSTVRTVLIRRDGSMLFSRSNGVFGFDSASYRAKDAPFLAATNRELARQVVFSMVEDDERDVWISSFEGIFRVNGNTGGLRHYVSSEESGWDIVRRLFIDSQGTLWAGTENGLMRFDPLLDRFTPIIHNPTDPGSILDGTVSTLFEDRSGVLWAGSEERGLSSLDLYEHPIPIYTYDPLHPARFPNGHVWDAEEATGGGVWLATTTGLYRWVPDGNTFQRTEVAGFASWTIRSLYRDRAGHLWIAPEGGGLCLFDETRISCRWVPASELPEGSINALSESADGAMWLGTINGASKLNTVSLRAETEGFQPRDNRPRVEGFVLSVLEDSRGIVWVGSELGLFRKKPEETQFFQIQPIEGAEAITAVSDIVESPTGKIWFVDRRVHVWDPETESMSILTSELPELAFRTPYGLTFDQDGRGWVQFDGAMLCFHDGTGAATVFSNLQGRISVQNWSGASTSLRDGTLLFGFEDGLYAVNPASLQQNPFPPDVLLTNMMIGTELVLPDDGGRLETSFPLASRVFLEYDDRAIRIDFSSTHFSRPDANAFQYKLEGLNDDWTHTKATSATFSNLEPGRYVFRVITHAPSGMVSSEKGLELIVRPPWWQTWWARILAVGLLAALVVAAFRVRVAAIVRTNERLEGMVEERTERLDAQSRQLADQARHLIEADQSKTRFFSNVSHELKTPLTLIRGYLEELRETGDGRLTKREEGRIDRSLSLTGSLDRLVHQLLDLARSEANKLKLNASRGELGRFIHKITTEFSGQAEAKDIQLILEIESGSVWTEFDPVKLHQIVSNLIGNAIKFTPEKGKVWVTLSLDQTSDNPLAVIEVADTGLGIPESLIENVFDRFYQVDDPLTRSADGFGIGLSLSHDFTELHGGTLDVVSEEGEGSVFTVRLPIRNTEPAPEFESFSIQSPKYVDIVKEDALPSSTAIEKSSIKLLVVEDNVELRQFLVDILEELFEVSQAADGAEAWEMLQKEAFDLVLSDVMMPNMDGMTLLRHIRSSPALRSLPVVLLTALGGSEEELAGIQARANDYISKPFNAKVLKARLVNLATTNGGRYDVEQAQLSVALGPEDQEFLERLNEYISQHAMEPEIMNSTLAEAMFVSERTFQRKVKEVTGISAAAFLRKSRLQRARRLLEKQEEVSVSRVSRAVGFQNVSYFSKLFVEEFGVEPSAYLS